jgi:hypothetical protein
LRQIESGQPIIFLAAKMTADALRKKSENETSEGDHEHTKAV